MSTTAITIDLDVSARIDIIGIGEKEVKKLTFSTSGGWGGDDYVLTVYNSEKKNEKAEISDALSTTGEELVIDFKPESQQIAVGDHYYEVFNKTRSIVEFKGLLRINK